VTLWILHVAATAIWPLIIENTRSLIMHLKHNVEGVTDFNSSTKFLVDMAWTKAPESDTEIVLAFYISCNSLYAGKCCHMPQQFPGSDLYWKERNIFRIRCGKNNSELSCQSNFCDWEIFIGKSSVTVTLFMILFLSWYTIEADILLH